METIKQKRVKIVICTLVFFSMISFFLYYNRELRFQSPFQENYRFYSVSEAVYGKTGNTYVIDQGRKSVIVLDEKKRLVCKLDGGSEDRAFFYAGKICDDDFGNVYVADYILGDEGNRIQKEHIIRLAGNRREVLYEVTYAPGEYAPMQYSSILDLKEYGGNVYFVKKGEKHIGIYRIGIADGQLEKIDEIPCELFVSDAAYDVASSTLIVTTRLSKVYYCLSGSTQFVSVPSVSDRQIPWKVSVMDGTVYYTDLQERKVFSFSLSAPEKVLSVYQNEDVLYALAASADGKTVTVTDNELFYYLDAASGEVVSCGEALVGNRFLVVMFWAAAVTGVIALVVLAVYVLFMAVKRIQDKANFRRMSIIVISSVAVAVIASYSSIAHLMKNHDELAKNNMLFFAESLRQQIDSDKLMGLDSISDYHSDVYMEVKDRLDRMIEAGYEKGIYYYYVIYNTDGRSINSIMDYEDSAGCGQPAYKYGDNEYTDVLVTGEAQTVSEISSYGAWMFTLLPVKDSAGKVIAELEVGTSLDKAVRENKRLVAENVMIVVCACSVMIMLILECMFAFSFFERRKKVPRREWDVTQQMPVRMLIFLSYMTDSMQDAFIAILCSKLYADTLPVPREIAIALPMSLELMTAAIFSMRGGRLAEKFGIRKVMRVGIAMQMAGFLVCMAVPGYMGILFGKLLIGMGLGTVYVTANTTVSRGRDSSFVEAGFADVSAGVLSGVTIGAGLGSIILSFANYHIVYMVGAVLLGCGMFVTIRADNVKFERDKNSSQQESSFHILKFILNRRIAVFFGLLLTPFMMSLAYREYFFPLYVEQFGIDEVQIGRIYLACGILVIYIGPVLSRQLLRMFGARKSVIFANLCVALDMALFVIMPGIVSVIAGMVILAVTISFAYTCQYTYFEGLEECAEAGMGNAMGIYSMFENIGQTLGPILYGAALTLGNRNGIFVLSGLMLLLVVLFSRRDIKRKV